MAMQTVAIIGFGFMGAVHAEVYRLLASARVVAIVDPRVDEVRATLRGRGWDMPVFPDYAAAAAQSDFSVVDICLPTDLHLKTALQAFVDGRHVFCEKPIALTVAEAEQMTAAAHAAGRQFMVGHCIRFWPEYEALKRAVDSGEFGRLVSLSLSRRNARPDYAVGGWVNDPARCVGAALDMHIHDTDFVCHLLGAPRAVSARAVRESTGWNSIASAYDFGPDGPLVFADGAWNYPQGWGFQMRFSAVFENAAMDFDSRANPTLTLTAAGEAPRPVTLPEPPTDGYRRELEYFINRLEADLPIETSTGAQAARSLAVTLAEIESAASGNPVSLNQ
jgi:predicted dehydrogenase